MNINKKYIIIFGTLILLLVFIAGAITYYNEKKEQAQISDVKQSVLSYSQDHPVGFNEVLGFINECRGPALFSDIVCTACPNLIISASKLLFMSLLP